MVRKKITETKQLPAATYLLIAAVAFVVSLVCIYYYLHNIQGQVSRGTSQQAFYLVLILFGIATSAVVFGAMNSYGVLNGKKWDTEFQFAGPVVGVLLVVLGGFYLPKTTPLPQTLAFRIVNERGKPVDNGKITLYLPHHSREENINNKGMAVFSDLTEEELTNNLKLDISSDGYTRLTLDTVLHGHAPVQLTLTTSRVVRLAGRVLDADDRPLKGVEILVEGTPYYTRTVNDGSYLLQVGDQVVGDEIVVSTSHKDYKDKTRTVKIESAQMAQVDFVLQPLPPLHR